DLAVAVLIAASELLMAGWNLPRGMLYMLSRMFSGEGKRDGRSAELRGTARERLLDAALAEFRERGYAAASLQGIAARAGLTTGAMYWSFRDKEALFLALVDERLDAPARELIDLAGAAPPEVETAPRVSRGVAALVREQPDLVLLAIEHWALAMRHEHVRTD